MPVALQPTGRRGSERGELARRTILETAERMYAERGINGVSLREIGAAAGQLNTGAVRYHFGSKLGLINAVFELRMAPINAARERMLAEIEAAGAVGEVRALVAAFALPLAGALGTRQQPSWYLRFAVQAGHVDGSAPTRLADQPWTRGVDRVRSLLLDAVDVPPALASLRWLTFAAHIGHALADRERELQEPPRRGALPHDLFISALFDTAVALVGAPVSPSTDRLLSGATP
jgi:AcrR family transcriptional regulator